MATFLILGQAARLKKLGRGLVETGHEVLRAETPAGAQRHLKTREVDLLILDLTSLKEVDAPAIKALLGRLGQAERLALTAPRRLAAAPAQLGLEPEEIIEGSSPLERITAVAEAALARRRLTRSQDYLRHTQDLIHRTENVIALAASSRRVLDLAARVAQSRHSVLLTGETGTGKGLMAGLIHFNSPRAAQPFVEVNCAALPETLLESELFGHVRGAFTNAIKDRVGRFEQADGGSILLDEIGDMPPLTQAKILRVLEEKTFERLGSSRSKRVDVRIMAATNKDPAVELRSGRFREDLYYRLNVITIHLPALRQRTEDIKPLAELFLERCRQELKREPLFLPPQTLSYMERHPWPGNIRQLRNTMERAALLAPGPEVWPEDLGLGPPIGSATTSRQDLIAAVRQRGLEGLTLAQAEEGLILDALERTNWSQKEAARQLGLTRRALNYKIAKLGLTHPGWTVNRPRVHQADRDE